MKKQDLSNLIDKYLNHECSPEEELLLNKYIENYQQKNQNWIENKYGNEQIIGEEIFAKVSEQINRKNLFQKAINSKLLLKVAASIVLLFAFALSVVYVSGLFKEKPVEITWNEKTTLMGEKWIVSLSDGSRIILNADSKLKYPAHFSNTLREIYLEGEAYFEIQHDSTLPFIVHSNNITTKVLGTKFNVSAFPNEKEISVSLVEGKVEVSKKQADSEERIVILKPQQQLVYNKVKGISTFDQFDEQTATGWKDNILKFNNVPLEKVFVDLERAYGVKFELTDKSFNRKKITADFKNDSFWTVAEVIKKLTKLNYKTIRENNELKKIVFYKHN